MNFLRNHTTLIIISFVATIVVIGLYYYLGNTSSSTATLTATPTATGVVGGNDLLASLSDLQSVKLDNTIFGNKTFVSLLDFGFTIPIQPVGRINPFAPLSGVAPASSPAPTASLKSVPTAKK